MFLLVVEDLVGDMRRGLENIQKNNEMQRMRWIGVLSKSACVERWSRKGSWLSEFALRDEAVERGSP